MIVKQQTRYRSSIRSRIHFKSAIDSGMRKADGRRDRRGSNDAIVVAVDERSITRHYESRQRVRKSCGTIWKQKEDVKSYKFVEF